MLLENRDQLQRWPVLIADDGCVTAANLEVGDGGGEPPPELDTPTSAVEVSVDEDVTDERLAAGLATLP